jgi:MFS family permease
MGYSALYTINPESYPTEIRNLGVGFSGICARITAVVAPLITSALLDMNHGFQIAVSAYAILFILCGLVGLLLKETRKIIEFKELVEDK